MKKKTKILLINSIIKNGPCEKNLPLIERIFILFEKYKTILPLFQRHLYGAFPTCYFSLKNLKHRISIFLRGDNEIKACAHQAVVCRLDNH
jgi:hypothetical protein